MDFACWFGDIDESKIADRKEINCHIEESGNKHSCWLNTSKPKTRELKPFNGVRSIKEFENFLWDMKQYFSIDKIGMVEQVNITIMYLGNDAKLRWRTRIKEDLNDKRLEIEI